MEKNTRKLIVGSLSIVLLVVIFLVLKIDSKDTSKVANNSKVESTKIAEKKPYNYDATDTIGLYNFVKNIDSNIKNADYSTSVCNVHLLSESNFSEYENGKTVNRINETLKKYEKICTELFNNNKEINGITYVQNLKDEKGNVYGNQVFIHMSRDKYEKGCFGVVDGTNEGLTKFFDLGCISVNGKIKTLLNR